MTTRASSRKLRSSGSTNNDSTNPTDKENSTLNGTKHEMKPSASTKPTGKSKASPKARAPKVYCTCRQPDDGSPMIFCAECKDWYHFGCVDLQPQDAAEIKVYICPACREKTGLHTVMDWEGPEALEEQASDTNATSSPSTSKPPPKPVKATPLEKVKDEPEDPEEESSEEDSADEYVAEQETTKTKGKRRARQVSLMTDSASGSEDERKKAPKRLRRGSAITIKEVKVPKERPPRDRSEPVSPTTAKRKLSVSSSQQHQSHAQGQPQKRHRSESTAGEDAARKYCTTKLQEVFVKIFTKYPFLPSEEIPRDEAPEPSKKEEDLTEEEQEILSTNGKTYASELEQCVFELYAEPDKHGKPSAGGKYKERFRMLTFNLSKPDRVVLHKRIASSHLTPKELSTMSSTDLADEETKLSIRQAEQEALAHSILKKTTLPTAKITHKGIQDIEDVSGASAREREREREREQEEEERIERERLARLKVQAQKAQQAAHANQQGSLPPESPSTPQNPSWGGPPPLPLHILHPHDPGPSGRPPVTPLFVQTPSEIVPSPVEGELNLADLINIDEEPTQDLGISITIPPPTPAGTQPSTGQPSAASGPTSLQSPSAPSPHTPTPVTGISPFAAKPSESDPTRRPSFDLNALWTLKDEPKKSPEREDPPPLEIPTQVEPKAPAPPATVEVHTSAPGEATDDQDFDMFLEGEEDVHNTPPPVVDDIPEAKWAAFEALPRIWSGKLSMPLDSSIPQEVSLVARQAGGRKLDGDSPLWNTLFPADHLRIDGRVPVDKSAQYLTHMRLNSTKELIAAAFSPESESGNVGFDALSTHLIAKGRHGLIFPWGNRPKDNHPGRELYIVPLLSSEPIPDYMDLLDHLQLPKIRNSNLLIGIWVLNKGKLSPPPPPASVMAVPPAQSAFPPPSSLPPSGMMNHVGEPSAQIGVGGPAAVPASVPGPSTAVQLGLGQTSPSTAILASEVASLTPEQIQLMLRTLSATAPIPPPPPPIPGQVPPSGLPPQMLPPHVSLQPYTEVGPNYTPAYPPPGIPPPPPPHPKSYQHPQHGQPYSSGYDRYDHEGPPPHMYTQDNRPPYEDYDYDYERGGGHGGERDRPRRGERNGRGERGHRGRSGGRNRNKNFERPRDSGWKGRGRGRAGPSSPPRDDRWGGSPQGWT